MARTSWTLEGDPIMWKYYLSFGVILAWEVPGGAAELPDLGKLDRHIAKEPAYTAQHPLYGLLVFGPKADKRVWFVLDSSKRDSARYDILYVDRNADGDLTPSAKRVVAKSQPGRPVFSLPHSTHPAT